MASLHWLLTISLQTHNWIWQLSPGIELFDDDTFRLLSSLNQDHNIRKNTTFVISRLAVLPQNMSHPTPIPAKETRSMPFLNSIHIHIKKDSFLKCTTWHRNTHTPTWNNTRVAWELDIGEKISDETNIKFHRAEVVHADCVGVFKNWDNHRSLELITPAWASEDFWPFLNPFYSDKLMILFFFPFVHIRICKWSDLTPLVGKVINWYLSKILWDFSDWNIYCSILVWISMVCDYYFSAFFNTLM